MNLLEFVYTWVDLDIQGFQIPATAAAWFKCRLPSELNFPPSYHAMELCSCQFLCLCKSATGIATQQAGKHTEKKDTETVK